MPLKATLRRVFLALALVAACVGRTVSAHEVPNDVTIQAYVRAEGTTLRVLVRVPLIAMRDMTWPFRSPGTLDLSRAASELHNAATLWVGDEVKIFEGSRLLTGQQVIAVRATPAGDTSFESYDRALGLLSAPPPAPDSTDITISEGFLDMQFEYPIESPASRFSIDERWGRLGVRTLTIVRLLLPDGTLRPFELQGDPGLVHLDPEWHQSARQFLGLGFRHFVNGLDYLLVLLCLILPFRRAASLGVIAGAFTIGSSVTLLAGSYGILPAALWFPPFIVTLVAGSLVYLAAENIVGVTLHRRSLMAAGVGLVYGYAFSFALRQSLQFAGSHQLLSRLAFAAGVDAALIAALALGAPLLVLLLRSVTSERAGTVVLSALAAHTGWHWMIARGDQLLQYQFIWPEMTPEFFVTALRLAMVLVAAAGLMWLFSVLLKGRDRDEVGARG